MNKQDTMKMQTHVLKVNIQCHCDGCKKKIKKLIQKTDGVYTTQINAEQGKVTVTGNLDPIKLIKKLEKSGKHAELWGPQKGFNLDQFKNMQIDSGKSGHGKDNKSQKGGGKGQSQQPQMMQQFKGSMKGLAKMPNNKDQKSVKFNMHKEEFDASDDDFDDEFDDEFHDDEFDDDDDFEDEEDDFGHGHHGHGHGNGNHQMMPNKMMPNKMMPMMGNGHGGFHGPQGLMNGPGFPNKNNGGGGGGKKGGGGDFEIPVVMKGKGDNKKDGKNGKKGDSKNVNGKNKDGKDKNGGKKSGGGLFGFMRSSSKKESKSTKEKSSSNNKGAGGGTNHNSNGAKKGGNNGDGGGKKEGSHNKMKQFDDFDFGGGQNQGGGKKMGQMGNPMGQFGGMSGNGRSEMSGAVQGLPTMGGGVGGGYYQHPGMGMAQPNPYSQQQQQYMAMMMNQQRQNMNDMYQPVMYGRPQYPVNYVPQYPPHHAPTDNYAHYFSDENTDSCSIM